MQWLFLFAATASLLRMQGVAGPSQAHPQGTPKSEKKLLLEDDPLAEWLYPGAKKVGESNGDRLPSIPLHGVQLQTSDSIDKVYFFFRKKVDPHFVADNNNGWNPQIQPAMLVTQFGPGAQSWSALITRRKDADSALMILSRTERTLT